MSKYDLPIEPPYFHSASEGERRDLERSRSKNPAQAAHDANLQRTYEEQKALHLAGRLTGDEINHLIALVIDDLYSLAGVLIQYSQHSSTHIELVKGLKPGILRMRLALKLAEPLFELHEVCNPLED